MEQFEMLVPTYYGMMYAKMDPHENHDDFAEPNVPVLIREAEGVRVVLGTHNFEDMSKPDIQIERRPQGWAIFLHPVGGGDASGLVYFLDDGRSFLIPDGLPSESIQVLDSDDKVPMIDDPPVKKPSCDSNRLPNCPVNLPQNVSRSLAQAKVALAGDSNDDEHDALLAVVEALDECQATANTADAFLTVSSRTDSNQPPG